MLDGFEATTVQTGETEIFLRRGGSGPSVLLLHGFPQTHLIWRVRCRKRWRPAASTLSPRPGPMPRPHARRRSGTSRR
jgi:pimeloyl-ACP methyl ester carboxylesterase